MFVSPVAALMPRRLLAIAQRALFGLLLGGVCGLAAAADGGTTALSGHVLPALAGATPITTKAAALDTQSLTLTVVLRRSDQAAFDRYLEDVYDPTSSQFRRFLTPQQVSDRFGPGTDDYAAVKGYFTSNGFAVVEDSANRMTLTLAGLQSDIRHALGVEIVDYDLAGHRFSANNRDPQLPSDIARRVLAVAGLSSLARPQPNWHAINRPFCRGEGEAAGYNKTNILQDGQQQCKDAINACTTAGRISAADATDLLPVCSQFVYPPPPPPGPAMGRPAGTPTPWKDVDGSGQTIGIVAYDTYQTSDVSDYFAYFGTPASILGNLSNVHIGGGATPGADQSEVLLDIDTVMLSATGAAVVVYDAPFSGAGSFQALFNRMINDGVTIITNSWSYCEDQTSLSDVSSIDAVLSSAAASGITVFNASGDSGSTCLDGGANTIGVPAGSPHAVAVGGTSMTTGPLATYLGETWWDGSAASPPDGQGGFGISRYFVRPAFQNGFTASGMRSVPDVAFNADPYQGAVICQASAGGCPAPLLFGGTSGAAPAWAAGMALVNQALGANVGNLNPAIYPLAASDAFHTAASMGSDFAHVGLGSPRFNALYLALAASTPGPASASVSHVGRLAREVSADGVAAEEIVVRLRDGNGNSIPGKTIALAASGGSHAIISPASGVTSADNGAVVFSATDATVEQLTFTATDVSDSLVLGETADVSFVSPPAASGGIMAFPTTVAADGVSTTAITITWRDADNLPSPGKYVSLSQGSARSVVSGPNPPLTDANGEIVFSATDAFEETVTYLAVDSTDGDLPIPGTALVTFSGSAAGSCVIPPLALGDYVLSSYINGFAAYPFFYGNTNFGCVGATDVAFDASGNAYVAHFQTGNLYRFGPDGGAATTPLSNLGPTLGTPVFDTDGRLYAAHFVTTGNFTTSDIVEIDPLTGAQLRVVASNLTCPNGLAFDPLSGDLFFDDSCSGAGSDNPSLYRLTDPAGTDPNRPTEVTVYATLPGTPNGLISFSPDGTIYVATIYPPYLCDQPSDQPILRISGTDGPSPPTITPLDTVGSCFFVRVGAVDANGAVRSLLVLNNDAVGNFLNLVDLTTNPPTQTPLARNLGTGTIGSDGCLYVSKSDTIYKLTPSSGICDFAVTNPSPTLALTPRIATPSPSQGSTQTMVATFSYLVVPVDTPVYFHISGANEQTRVVRTNANGVAALDYQGRFAGDDVITVTATVGATALISNPARVTWMAGPHISYLGLSGPLAAVAGQPIVLQATLDDVAVDPQVAIAGAAVQFTVGAQSCTATTGADGSAGCSVTLATPGVYTLTASYAGSALHLPASQSMLFVVPTDGVDLIFVDGFDGG